MSEPRSRVSKRLRYAVLARDDFTCQYCGARGPEAPLTVDHVVPVALGGTNEPSNLVTACEPCNSGKTSTTPTDATVAEVDDSARRWADAMRQAATEVRSRRTEADAVLDRWAARWNAWTYHDQHGDHALPLPGSWRTSLRAMLEAGADVDTLIDLVDVAMSSKARDRFKYFCGCGWNTVRELHARAREILDEDGPPEATTWLMGDREGDAYWVGHAAGWNEGYDSGWEAGLSAGEHRTQERQGNYDPIPLSQILPAAKDQ